MTLTINEYLLLVVAVVALLPIIPMVKWFVQTRINEYLLFGTVFILSSLFAVTSILAQETNSTHYWQVNYSIRNLTYFLFFIHTIRMLWYKVPEIVLLPGVILFSLTQFLILFWIPIEPSGAGVFLSTGQAIYSTEYRLIGNLFQTFVALLFLYGYSQIKLDKPTSEVRNTIRLMLLFSSALLLSRLYRLFQNFGLSKSNTADAFGNLLIVLGFSTIGLVYLLNPTMIGLSNDRIYGLMIISKKGLPISSYKFEGNQIESSPSLLAGILTAIDTVLGSITDNKHSDLQHVQAESHSILLEYSNEVIFAIITGKESTHIVRNSLRFFVSRFITQYLKELSLFNKTGEQIRNIESLLHLAFPFSAGLDLSIWE